MDNIKFQFDKISYNDDEDHFKNGILRLLSLTQQDFEQWIILSNESNEDNILNCLSYGFQKLKNNSINFNKENLTSIGPEKEIGNIWYNSIAENNSFGIAKSLDGSIGWLVKNTNNYIRENDPPIYEENYFEGDFKLFGGYGNYIKQSNWRLEKSTRQVKELIDITGINSGNVLDIGSGYGYFRKALDDIGFIHSGIEISKYAAQIAKSMYGFDTYIGSLYDYKNILHNKYDIITLWDVIEHVADPLNFLKDIYNLIKPEGFLIIKTPNINCPEANLFGSYYHSFKREHLVYFSKDGLENYAKNAGFNLHKAFSISHILNGFVGKDQTNYWAQNLQGSDLLIYFKKEN